MGFIQNLVERSRERKRRVQEAEDNDRIFSNVEEKKLSHGERELIKVLEKEKQQAIAEALKWEERRRQADEKLKGREMMKFNPEFFNDDIVLRQKNLFLQKDDFLWH